MLRLCVNLIGLKKRRASFTKMQICELLKSGYSKISLVKEAAFLDREVILAHLLGVSKEYLLAHGDEEVSGEDALVFYSYADRIALGEPVAYITCHKEFYGNDFFVDKRVLVPRPETEMIVEMVIKFIEGVVKYVDGSQKLKLVDVGTGSGCIAISIAKHFQEYLDDPLDEVFAVDISEDALEVCKINIDQHGLEDKVQAFQSDLLEFLEDGEVCDIIVANLPYIGEVENRFVEKNVEEFEPNVALFGGYDGLELYKKMFQQIKEKEVKFKLMIGEFGFAQGEKMGELLSKYFEQDEWGIEEDLAGIERVFVVKKKH